MSQQLINLSPDLKRIQNEGYELEIRNGHALISNVPYVNNQKEVKFGTLVSNLTLNGNVACKPSCHVMYFAGEQPCNLDGAEIQQIKHTEQTKLLANGIHVDRSFSNKPPNGYDDYWHKFTQYIAIISNPAKAVDHSVTAKTFRPVEAANDSEVFKYVDTNSSRAGISAVSAKLVNQKIAIVGLGGTGAYILDLVAKTPVKEIHLFDGDEYCQHNAFRSPGAVSLEELKQCKSKVEFYKTKYGQMRRGIFAHDTFIDENNLALFDGMHFVFVSVDNGSAKKAIFNYLKSKAIPFIDVGLGVQLVDDKLNGILRTTLCTSDKADHLEKLVSMDDGVNDVYSSNIQIAELNAFNASHAVIKWKKWSGFYHDHIHEHNTTYTLDVNMLLGDENDDAA